MREVIATHIEDVQAALAVAPQTNGVGRSAALLAGLFDLVAASGVRRIRLLELGASAGLNLLVDQYAFGADSWHFGPSDSKVQFADAISGAVHPESFEVVARAGCDLNPVDATTADGRLLLTSFVWPFDLDRHNVWPARSRSLRHTRCESIRRPQASGWPTRLHWQNQRRSPWYGIRSPRCTGRPRSTQPSRRFLRAGVGSSASEKWAWSFIWPASRSPSPSCVPGYGARMAARRLVSD
jgi:hypothetical protein